MKALKLFKEKPEHGSMLGAREWEAIKNWIRAVKPGRWVKISFMIVYNLRSPDQNSWYWTQLTAFAEEFGWNTPDEVHEYFKSLFLKTRYTLPNGTLCETIGTTTSLTTVEFNEYVEKCRIHSYHHCNFKWEDPKPKRRY